MKKNFYWRFSRKIEGKFWIFYKRFPWEKNWMEEILKGISLKYWSWIHTRASLARAVFSFKTFFDCEWRSHLLSPTTSTSWNESERSEWLWTEAKRVKKFASNRLWITRKRIIWRRYLTIFMEAVRETNRRIHENCRKSEVFKRCVQSKESHTTKEWSSKMLVNFSVFSLIIGVRKTLS